MRQYTDSTQLIKKGGINSQRFEPVHGLLESVQFLSMSERGHWIPVFVIQMVFSTNLVHDCDLIIHYHFEFDVYVPALPEKDP
jgi:hypothetical protein